MLVACSVEGRQKERNTIKMNKTDESCFDKNWLTIMDDHNGIISIVFAF